MLNQIRQWWFERRSFTSGLTRPQPWLREALGAEETYSGESVTPETALRNTAVFACIRVLSESVAGLPLHIYQRTAAGRDVAVRHPAYRVLHRRPNGRQTSFEYRQLCMAHLLLYGNSYSEIVRDQSGNVSALWPIHPSLVTVKPDGFEINNGGKRIELPWESVLHLKGLSCDGIVGLSPIQAARQSIGLSQAAERFGSLYFGKGSRPGGVLSVPDKLNVEQTAALQASFQNKTAGPENMHRTLVLSGGSVFTPLQISNEDSQFMELRRFGVEDICRIFRVPGFMVADLSKANYSNVDAMDRAFLKNGVLPWLQSIEQTFSMRLLSESDQDVYYVEHDASGSMRGSPVEQMQSFQLAIHAGILSPNDCRRMLNLNPRPDGDTYLQATNLSATPFSPAQQISPAPGDTIQ